MNKYLLDNNLGIGEYVSYWAGSKYAQKVMDLCKHYGIRFFVREDKQMGKRLVIVTKNQWREVFRVLLVHDPDKVLY